jgi:transmembrane sensor
VTHSDEQIRSAIAQQAAEWFIANQTGSLGEEDAAEFLAWLKVSPVHVREYLGIARVARHLPEIAGEPGVPLETFLAEAAAGDDSVVSLRKLAPAKRRFTARDVWSRTLPIAASVLALAVGALWWAHDGELVGIPKTYTTAHGEQRLERLPDGSLLRLDTDSQATVRYSGQERLVEIRRGQALLDVVHESKRRFRVAAGEAGAIAVGTQFNVYKKTGAVEFTVAQGAIAVFRGTPSWLSDRGSMPDEVLHVTTGYAVRIDSETASPEPVAVKLDQALAWSQHKIVFEHRPLGEVAAEFNRYGSIPVEIDDEELRMLAVSGMFDAGDTESFVAFLQRLPGVRVERASTLIRVTRIKTTT